MRGTIGLLGRLLVILLAALLIEFATSTWLYERAGRMTFRQDEAHRLSEHMAITRKLMADTSSADRAGLARVVSSDRFRVRWSPRRPDPSGRARLDLMTRQVINWEPELGGAQVSLWRSAGRRDDGVSGELQLPDGTWLLFATRDGSDGSGPALHRMLLALGPTILLLGLGAIAVRRTLHPIRALAAATDRIGYGEPVHVDIAGTAEVKQLIEAYNAMQMRIHQLVEDRTQALAAVGHDLRTPVARLQLRAEAVQPPSLRSEIERDIRNIEAMLASLMAFLAGEDDPEAPTNIDLAVTVATIVEDFSDHGSDVTYAGPEHLETRLRPSGMRRAIVNLIENAVHYGQRARVALSATGDTIVIAIEDDGPGIPEERIASVTQPFVRLDPARSRNTQGLGLGLAIVLQAVEREGGLLRLTNRTEGGLRAELQIPR